MRVNGVGAPLGSLSLKIMRPIMDLKLFQPNPGRAIWSWVFIWKGCRSCIFTGQHKDYHKPSDDSLNLLTTKVSSRLLILVVDPDSSKINLELAFTKTKDESSKMIFFKVTLGIMPDYLYSDGGIRLDGVTEGKPAFFGWTESRRYHHQSRDRD